MRKNTQIFIVIFYTVSVCKTMKILKSMQSIVRPIEINNLHVACCMLHAACCMLHVACCMLHVACCMLHVACCMLQDACCILHVVLCIRMARCL